MSDFKHQNGFGSLFVSQSQNPKAPTLSGQFTDDSGKTWDIAAWKATDRDGKPKTDKHGKGYFSLKITKPRQAESKPAASQGSPPSQVELWHQAIADCTDSESLRSVAEIIRRGSPGHDEGELASLRESMRRRIAQIKEELPF